MIEDRRKPLDLNRPVAERSTVRLDNPAEYSPERAKVDRFRAQTAMYPLEEYRPNAFKRRLKR